MPFDASQASLPELFRSLNVAPEEKEALVRLAEQVARLEHEREHQEMLFEASGPPPPPPPPGGRRRGRAHLWVVKAVALPLAGLAAFTRAHARHLLAATAGAALLTGGTLAPDVLQPAPAAQAPHHRTVAHRHRDRDIVVLPPGMPVIRKRRRLDNDDAFKAPRAVAPSAAPSPAADPTPTAAPDPSPTLPPPPFPTPTCTPLHGKHCHPGAGEAVSVLGALRGLTGQP